MAIYKGNKYMEYSFTLEFNELSDELIQAKIDKLIHFNFMNGNYDDGSKLEELLENENVRGDAGYDIEMHFPIYF